MKVFFGIAYVIIGFVQLFAIADGIDFATGIGGFLSVVGAFFVTYIPLLGSGLGVYGAVQSWDWSIVQALALFFWYVPVVIVLTAYSALSER